MSDQKIEFLCTNCRSLLRLSAEHVGKRARCPVCNSVEVVTGNSSNPVPANPDPFPPPPNSTSSSVAEGTGKPPVHSWRAEPPGTSSTPGTWAQAEDFSRPPVDSPYVTPRQGPDPVYVPTQSADGCWIAGTVIGSLSIVLACGCGCYGSIPALVLSGVGLLFTVFSRSPNRWVPFLLNGIGCGVGLLFLGVLGFFLVLGMMNP